MELLLNLNSEVLIYSLIGMAVGFLVAYLFLPNYNKTQLDPKLSEEEFKERVRNFRPRALAHFGDKSWESGMESVSEVAVPDASETGVLNLVKLNFYGFIDNEEIKQDAEAAIRKYGVGSCGPRGFYGTIDIHLTLEERLANFLGMEETVLYSYGFATISSGIGAYCRKSDYIFVDEKINFAAKQGLMAARGTEIYFKHNDIKDLEEKMMKIHEKEDENENKEKFFKKFLIVEGIYGASGKICPLPEIVNLCRKYKVRLFIDETYSFGILGKTGRGVTEHFDIQRSEVDMIMASLEGSLGSVGGFCAGSHFIIEHQRLSGLGYCFSASLPPLLCQSSISALNILERNPEYIDLLRKVSLLAHNILGEMEGYSIISADISPLKVLTLTEKLDDTAMYEKLDRIYIYCVEKKIFMEHLNTELKFHCNIHMEEEEIEKVKTTLEEALNAA